MATSFSSPFSRPAGQTPRVGQALAPRPPQVEHRRAPAPGVTTRMCLCDQMRKAGLRNR